MHFDNINYIYTGGGGDQFEYPGELGGWLEQQHRTLYIVTTCLKCSVGLWRMKDMHCMWTVWDVF